MKYNFLMDAYENEYSAFVTDFSKYEVIDETKKETSELKIEEERKYANFIDDESLFNDESVFKEEEITPTILEEDVSGFVLEDFNEDEIKEEPVYNLDSSWLEEINNINTMESLEKISAQLYGIETKLGRICDGLEKIFNLK